MVVILCDTAHKTAIDQSDAPKFFNDNNLNFYSRTQQLTNLAINYFPKPTCAAISGRSVILNWITNKEKNNAYYTVEKSLNQRNYTSLKPNQVLAYNNNRVTMHTQSQTLTLKKDIIIIE